MSKLIALTCPQCQAPVSNRTRCEYCGSVFDIHGVNNFSLNVSVNTQCNKVPHNRDFAEMWNRNSLMTSERAANDYEARSESLVDRARAANERIAEIQDSMDKIKTDIGNAFIAPIIRFANGILRIFGNAS